MGRKYMTRTQTISQTTFGIVLINEDTNKVSQKTATLKIAGDVESKSEKEIKSIISDFLMNQEVKDTLLHYTILKNETTQATYRMPVSQFLELAELVTDDDKEETNEEPQNDNETEG